MAALRHVFVSQIHDSRCLILIFALLCCNTRKSFSLLICPDFCQCISSLQNSHLHIICDSTKSSKTSNSPILLPKLVTKMQINCGKKRSESFRDLTFRDFFNLRDFSVKNCDDIFDRTSESRVTSSEPNDMINKSFNVRFPNFLPNSLEKLSIVQSRMKTNRMSAFWEHVCSLNLKLLKLSRNGLFDIPPKFCYGLNQLIILDLEGNYIADLRPEFIRSFANLRILNLSHNRLKKMPNKWSEATTQLSELYLSYNSLSELTDLPQNLVTIDLSVNSISQISSTWTMKSVKVANLSHNRLEKFVAFFAPRLQVLDVSNNSLTKITAQTLANAPDLKIVNFDNNMLNYIESRSFHKTPSLQVIQLRNNQLTALNIRSAFEGLLSLIELDLSLNQLSALSDSLFSSNFNLRELKLNQNDFKELPSALFLLPNLERLSLAGNKITKLRKFILDHLTKLSDLNLAHNRLEKFESRVFSGLTSLRRVNLSFNRIKFIDKDAFGQSSSLSVINLQNNFLSSLHPATFLDIKSLVLLNLSSNKLEYFNWAVCPASLEELYAADNNISLIGGKSDEKLRVVDFSQNYLAELYPGTVPDTVEYANFSRNSLSKIAANTLRNKTKLLAIDISFNTLQHLHDTSIRIINHRNANLTGPYLNLFGNPLICDCHLNWVKNSFDKFAMESSMNHSIIPRIFNMNRMECKPPAKQSTKETERSRFVMELSASDFLCEYKTSCIADCPCCEFDVCDCKNICPIKFCRCFEVDDNSAAYNIVECSKLNVTLLVENNHADGVISCSDDRFGSNLNKFLKSLPMHATRVFLDGGFLCNLEKNAFLGRYKLKSLHLNKSNIERISPAAFSGLTALEFLDLSHNEITSFSGDAFVNVNRLEVLLLNDNSIERFTSFTFSLFRNLKRLTLHGNKMTILPDSLVEIEGKIMSISLGNNPWICNCSVSHEMKRWFSKVMERIVDGDTLLCHNISQHSSTFSMYNATAESKIFMKDFEKTVCRRTQSSNGTGGIHSTHRPISGIKLTIAISIFSSIMILLLVCILVCKTCSKRIERNKRCSSNSRYKRTHSIETFDLNQTKMNVNELESASLLSCKLFVFYSKSDERFIEEAIAPRLEKIWPYSICRLHEIFPDLHRITFRDIYASIISCSHLFILISDEFLADHYLLKLHSRTLETLRERDGKLNVMFILDYRFDRNANLGAKIWDEIKTYPYNFLHMENHDFWARFHDVSRNLC